jgi:hypothetical protein
VGAKGREVHLTHRINGQAHSVCRKIFSYSAR